MRTILYIPGYKIILILEPALTPLGPLPKGKNNTQKF